jgi:hypothetical protein
VNPKEIDVQFYSELVEGASLFVPTIRVWLLEMYVRGCLAIHNRQLNAIEGDSTPLNRQVYLIRGLNKDVNYFRRNKTRFEQKNAFEKHYFLLGATCLPDDELKAWLASVRGSMSRPLDRLFCNWVQSKRDKLDEVVRERTVLARD